MAGDSCVAVSPHRRVVMAAAPCDKSLEEVLTKARRRILFEPLKSTGRGHSFFFSVEGCDRFSFYRVLLPPLSFTWQRYLVVHSDMRWYRNAWK